MLSPSSTGQPESSQVIRNRFEFLGNSMNEDIGSKLRAKQTSFEYTATRSIFTFEARNISFTVTFLSPVTPKDNVRTSLPLSYLSVEVDPKALEKHKIAVYSDITGAWATADGNADLASDSCTSALPIARSQHLGADLGLYRARGNRHSRDKASHRDALRRAGSASRMGPSSLRDRNGGLGLRGDTSLR